MKNWNRILAAGAGAAAVVSLAALPASAAGGDLDCSDFANQADAQAEFNSAPGDPHGLDRDGDQLACESLPGDGDANSDDADTEDSDSTTPVGGVDTGAGSTDGPEALGLFAVGGLALVGAGVIGYRRFGDAR